MSHLAPDASLTVARTLSIAAVLTLFCAVVFGFGFYLFSLLATSMRHALGFGYAEMGMMAGAAQVAYFAASLMCPRLSERFGTGRVIASGTALAGVLLMLLAAAQTPLHCGVALAGLGLCAALMMVPTVDAVTQCIAFSYQSRVHGLISSGTAYGQLANALLVPWLLPEHGWRMIWLVAGTSALAITLAGWMALRRLAPQTMTAERPHLRATAAEAARQSLATSQNFRVWLLLALCGMACGPWQNFLASFLTAEHGQSLATVGRMWATIGALGLFSGYMAGVLADKAGVRLALVLSFVLLAGAGLFVAVHSQPWHLKAAALCFGLSFYAVYGLVPAYISKTVALRAGTQVFAIANVFLAVGTTLGNVIGGQVPGAFGSLQGVFWMAAGLSLAGAIITLGLADERQPRSCA